MDVAAKLTQTPFQASIADEDDAAGSKGLLCSA
jgi:hypothetical protein